MATRAPPNSHWRRLARAAISSRRSGLKLFTPARYDDLDSFPFPADGWTFPTKDEMADYLEAYAARFELPVRTGVRVERLSRDGDRFVVSAGEEKFEAENVVVAMADFQCPRAPQLASELNPGIVQLHSFEYRNPSQLRDGGVLVVGSGNSGAEISLELSRTRRTYLSGRDTGHMPFRIEGAASRLLLSRLVLRFVFHRVLTASTPIGRRARPKMLSRGTPLIRVKPRDLASAGIERVPKVVGVRDGLPLLEDGRVLDVANVVWSTGFDHGFPWIELPIFGDDGEIMHERGVVEGVDQRRGHRVEELQPHKVEARFSVGRDADHVAKRIASRVPAAGWEALSAGGGGSDGLPWSGDREPPT
jgi:putative flavoprotein involved in K+ transport